MTIAVDLAVSELLEDYARRGVDIALKDGKLAIRAPRGVLGEDDKCRLALNKARILDHLAVRCATPEAAAATQSFPLTEIQQAYWVGRNQVELGNIGCHAYREFAADGLDLTRLEDAWNRLIARHDMLRAEITADGRHHIPPTRPRYTIREEVLPADPEPRLAEIRDTLSHHTFDPARWPLFDIRASRCRDRLWLHVGMDLLIADATSMLLLYREWGALYENPDAPLPEQAGRFADHVLAVGSDAAEEASASAYWRPRLAALPGPPRLPYAREPGSLVKPRFVRHSRTLSAAQWASLKAKARENGLTASNVLVCAYADTLAGWSRSRHFLLTLTAFDAPAAFAGVVGDFTTTLLCEVDASAPTFLERARAVQARLAQDMDHKAWSGVRVVREAARVRGARPEPVPVVFTSTLGRKRPSGEAGLPSDWLGQSRHAITQTPQVTIDHHVLEEGDRLVVSWDAIDALFPDGLVAVMFGAYADMLQRLADGDAAWQAPASAPLPQADAARRAKANATARPVPDGLLHDAFFARAATMAEAPAVVEPDRTITYGALADAARRVSGKVGDRGLGPGDLVGVCMAKGWRQAAAVMGILNAGAAYLPIDPALPAARRHRLAQNGALSLVVTDAEPGDWPRGVEAASIDALDPAAPPPRAGVSPRDLAYVIYTSGSTGEPKGVMVEHRAALNTVADINRRFAVGREDAILGLSSLSFDLSVYDVFGVLGAGGRLVLPRPRGFAIRTIGRASCAATV